MTTTDRTARYLDDLARMLADLDPVERDDVLAGVREHLDATLAEHPDDPSALDRALARLGPPERIAAEARGTSVPHDPRPTPTWPRIAVWLVGLTTAPFLLLLGVLLVLDGVLTSVGADAGSGRHSPLMPHPGELVLAATLLAPVWLAAAVATMLAKELSRRSTALLVAAGPAAVLLSLPALAAGAGFGTVLAGVVELFLAGLVVLVGRDALLELRGRR